MQLMFSGKTDLINKLIKTKVSNLLFLSVAFSVIFTQIIVLPMSIFFRGKVTHDFVITGIACSFLVSLVVCYLLVHLINQVREGEEMLRASEENSRKGHENFMKIFSAAPVGLLLLNRETVITQANEALGSMVLRDPAQVIGMRAGGGLGCVHSLEEPRGCGYSKSCPECLLRRGIENVLAEGTNIHGALINLTVLINGSPRQRWLNVSAEPYEIDGSPYVIVTVDDYTDKKMTEDALVISEFRMKQSLREKETLLREVHHRVKNNLAVVSSLLALQSRQIKDDTLRAVFKDSQQRIRAMALVHEKLYQTADFSQIDFGDYINTIVKELLYTFKIEGKDITIRTDIADIKLDLGQAIPCGMILNELLTNSFKYAFPGDGSGEINVTLIENNGIYALTIRDNGIGLPEGFDYKESDTLGLQLVEVLAKQLRGTLQVNSGGGTEATITFRAREDGNGKEEDTYS